MTAGERWRNWIDAVARGWADRLGHWAGTFIGAGIDAFFKILGKSAAPKLKPIIDMLEKSGKVPPELQPLLDEMKDPTGEFAALLSQSAGGAIISGGLSRILDILLLPISYALNEASPVRMPDENQLTAMRLRGIISPENYERYLKQLGDNPLARLAFEELSQGRIDPMSWITAFRRKYPNFAQVENDLRDQGWSPARIEALKFVTEFYPAPADLIRWQAREVFEPDMIQRYGLDSEFGAIEKEPFYKAGMTDEQILNYWRAHWEHASWMQVVEMLHRGLMTEEQVYDWFRVVEIPPFWRQKLIDTAYTWPTRVDVRRWWDMRTIDETELRRLYSGMGYRGVNLDNYVLWTKVYVAFPDLMARWSKGWITLDEVRTELTALGMPAERVEEMIQQKVKPQEPERVDEGKALTKTEIYKGVKAGLITWDEGIELLQDLGYDYDEADYILTINVETLAGSPETFEDFKAITQKYKIATGREAKPMPEEIKKAADEVVRLTADVEALELSIKEEERGLIDQEVIPEETTRRLKGLQVKRNRAISTLEKARSDYNRQVAEWKHGLP